MSDFKAKMQQIRFRLGSLQRSPDPLAGFKGPTSKREGGRENEGGEGGKGTGKGKGREGEKGREGKAFPLL